MDENHKGLRSFLNDVLFVIKTTFLNFFQSPQAMLNILQKHLTIAFLAASIFVSCLYADIVAAQQTALESVVSLTAEEQTWLDKNHTVRVRVVNFPPFIIVNKGEEPTGVSIDYLNIIAARTGIRFKYIHSNQPFAKALENLKNRQDPDLIQCMMRTPGRESFVSFSRVYLATPRVIFTRTEGNYISQIEDLFGQTIAVPKGTAVQQEINKKYPEINLLLLNSDEASLEAVSGGKADAYIGNLSLGSYLILQRGFTNLKVATPSPLSDHAFSFGIRKDWPEVSSIIDKGLDTITPGEKLAIRNKYFSLRYDYGISGADILKWVMIVAVVVSGIIFLFVFWNRRMAKEVRSRKVAEQSAREARNVAEEATRAKSDFLANMSHEIRTPMNAVIGMAHLALKTELTPKQKDYLNKIRSSANSLLGIINDILDFSKIEAGKLDMEAAEFDLSEILVNVANVITVKAQEKENLEVLFYLDSRLSKFLVGDPLRLNQILVNLGNNAVKFTEKGEIVLRTKIQKRSEDKVTLQFSMRDTGIGMTAEQQANLFQAFSQADTSTTRKYGGTGLGLTISKRLVNMMGGEIRVESEPGQGTTFSFTADFGLGKKTVKRRFVPSPDLRGLRVLVVDDSATSRQILQDILESFSFEVNLAASGEDALKEIEKVDKDQPFGLVIMDWKMPGMDGLEASRRIKTHKTLSKIPAIVLVTAYGREKLIRQADEIGLEGFLLKPVSSSMLLDAIMQALGREVQDVSRVGRKKEQSAEELSAISGARVLLVEDNEINQQVALEILQGAGLNVTVANNGKEGVDAATKNQYDAILMDIQMPVMDGYEATKRIRDWEVGMREEEVGSRKAEVGIGKSESGMRNKIRENSDLKSEIRNHKSEIKSVPIIAMTAHAMAGDEQKSIKAGMNDHVTKPIDPGQLFAALQKWIKPGEKIIERQQPPVPTKHPESDQTVPNEEALPESLPGFDLAAGLKRLMGNKCLYRKLLVDFGTKYVETASEIRKAIDAKDFEQIHSLIHNLKGLAGNLEAGDLQAAAVEMEKLVKGQTDKTISDKELNQKFAELEKAINQALEAVQTLGLPAEEKIVEPSAEWLAEVPVEQVKEATDRIKTAVGLGDVMKIKSIAEELKSESDAVAPFCDELIRLADDFDFDGIQKIVLQLDS
jgi:signal transduction histidine kinase/DNA-binding response OmpR family regulator/HPt (histidine-containing phosphotransfer) domain-containing protein